MKKTLIRKLFELFRNKKIFCGTFLLISITIILLIIIINKNDYGVDKTNLSDYSVFANVESTITNVIPTKMNNNYLDIDSAFEIVTNEEMTIENIRKSIALTPAIDYIVEQIDNKHFLIIPKEKIPYNTLLNVISVVEGTPLYKWAFETEKILSVKSTYPADTKTIYPNSVIEVTLTYADVKNFEECFSISDNVKGRFEKNGYTYRFIPETKLKKGKTYTVTIKKGLTNGNHTMNSNYTFSFTVEETGELSADEFYFTSMNIDDSLVFTPDEIPRVDIKFYNKNENSLLNNTTTNVEIYKVDDINTYISLLEMEKINFDTLELFDKFKTDIVKFGDSSYSQLAYIKFHKTLPIGNYIVKYSIGDVSKYHSIQISNIVAYVGNTEKDILAWINDYETGKSAMDATISFKNKSSLTNENGIAIVKDFSKEKLGNYAKISYDNENLVLKLQSFNDTYYDGYLYTDRPLYKTTDTINIWGIIPNKNLSKSKDVYIMFLDKKYPVSINSDGVFTTKIDIKDLKEGYGYLQLYMDNHIIAGRSFQIEQYETPNYIYNIETDKEAYFENETIKITVTASHISGIKAVDKKLNIIYENQNISCYTDNNGKCTVSMIATKEDSYYYITESQFIRVFPADSVDSEDLCHASITMINEKEEIITKPSNVDGKYLIDITGNSLNIQNGAIKRKNDINSKVIVDIYEVSYDIKEVTKVDEYTKKTYTYNEYNNYQQKIIETKKYNLKNGKLIISDLNYPDIKTNKNYKYYYFKIKLENSILDKTEYYISSTTTSYYTSNPYSTVWYKNDAYYSYTFPKTELNYSISSKIDLTVNDYYKKEVNDKKMTLFYNDSVVDYYIDENEVSYKDEYFPGINIAGAIFDGKKIHKIDSKYLDYNDSDREVNITLNTDKEIYAPQDIVTVDVKVNDKDGKPIKTNLLISVVNEGVFELNGDYISLQQTLYVNKYFNFYHFTTYQAPIYDSSILGGRGAAAAGVRSDFGDTIYFKNIQTDENGYAKISFKLNDSITTFRITAISANKDLYVGKTYTTIKSQLDYFIENSSLDGFKSSDDFVVALNTISDSNNNINYTFELNDKISSASSLTNNYLYQNFGKLNKGNYNLKISSAFGNKTDKIIDNFIIKDYYQNVRIVNVDNLKNGKQNIKSNNVITIELYDKSLEFYLKLINNLSYSGNDRLDQYVARKKGLDFYSKYNNTTINNNVSIPNKLISNNKLLLLENAQFSPLLNALVVNYAESMLNSTIISQLKYNTENYLKNNAVISNDYFDYILLATSLETITLEDLNKLVPRDINDSISLALAYAFIGDYDNALKIYNDKIINDENYKHNKELITILLSFIDPNKCKELLIELEKSTNEYYAFAVISYLENTAPFVANNKIIVNDVEHTLNALSVLSFTYDPKDIENLKISSENDNIIIRKVYYGNANMIDSKYKIYDLNLSLNEQMKLNQIYQLKVELNNIPKDKCGNLYIVLPRGIRYYSVNENSSKGMYISSNSGNKIDINVCTYNGKNNINFEIPVIATLEGNYIIESAIYNHNVYYGTSEEIKMNIQK